MSPNELHKTSCNANPVGCFALYVGKPGESLQAKIPRQNSIGKFLIVLFPDMLYHGVEEWEERALCHFPKNSALVITI